VLTVLEVDLSTIQQSFDELEYPVGSWASLTCTDLMTLLIDMLAHTQGKERRPEELEMLADLSLNLILNLFDKLVLLIV